MRGEFSFSIVLFVLVLPLQAIPALTCLTGLAGLPVYARPESSPPGEHPNAAKSVLAGAQNRVNILSAQPQPSKDYTKILDETIAAGKTAFLPASGSPYVVSDSLQFDVPGAGLAGEPGTVIAYTGKSTLFRIRAANITFKDITFNGSRLGYAGKSIAYSLAPHFHWIGGGMRFGCPIFLQKGSDDAVLENLKCEFCSASAITVQANNVSISNCEFNNNVGFGIIASDGATNFVFKGNHGNSNGLEIIAASHGASDGQIINNNLSGSGDNGISVSGERIHVIGNVVKLSLGHGIAVYGDNNTIRDNQIIDNCQVDNPSAKPILLFNNTNKNVYHCKSYAFGGKYFGIKVVAGSGGHGSHNIVVNNVVIDNQEKPTQGGILVAPGAEGNTIGPNKVGRHRE